MACRLCTGHDTGVKRFQRSWRWILGETPLRRYRKKFWSILFCRHLRPVWFNRNVYLSTLAIASFTFVKNSDITNNCFNMSLGWMRGDYIIESLSTDVFEPRTSTGIRNFSFWRVLLPVRRKCQVVNAKMRALKHSVWAWKRANGKNINFLLTSVAQKRLCLRRLIESLRAH